MLFRSPRLLLEDVRRRRALALQRVDASPLTPLSGELEPQPGLRLVPPVRLLRSEWSAALDAALDADGVQPPT